MNLFELIKPEKRIETSKPIRVLGIDLGTTNSVVAEIRWNPKTPKDFKSVCIEIDQETTGGVYTNFLVPSVIALPNNDKMVGEGAKRLYGRMVEFGLAKDKNIFFECKNEMGCRKPYSYAPEGYRSPAEISGKILEFLKNGVSHDKDYPTTKTLITVPASFQVAQRIDTLKAAELAGISILEGELIDEPIAAFIDFLLSENLEKKLKQSNKLLVFDFGGGTCDVAVYRIDTNISSKCLDVSPLTVSRYHRLGGGDIDRAIIHQVLLPQLLEQNNLKPLDLDYEDKKNFIEPALTAVAQALKIGLCNEINHLESFGKYESKNKREVTNQQPGMHKCKLKDRCLKLQSPSLTAEEFEKLLEPFLDQDLLYARETEYSLTNSIFSPIEDALERGRITPSEIDGCLMVGGSSLIPQVQKAMGKHFPNADILKYKDIDSPQLAIAKGATYHALALEVLGRGIFQTVAQDTILIKTESGPIELIQRGEPLPSPIAGEWGEVTKLVVPKSAPRNRNEMIELRMEFFSGTEGNNELDIFSEVWAIPNGMEGKRLLLKYRLDKNQVFEFELSLLGQEKSKPYKGKVENPLTNVVNPNETRKKINEAEEELRNGAIPKSERPEKIVEIATDYHKLNQTEKAISYLQKALKMGNEPDLHILNLLGIYYASLDNWEKAKKHYREAAKISNDSTPLFNLAILQKNNGRYKDAKETIEESLLRKKDGPALTLKAMISKELGEEEGSKKCLDEAFELYGDKLDNMSDWEIGWLLTAAKLSKKENIKKEVKAEQEKRSKGSKSSAHRQGLLPGILDGITKE